MNLPPIFEDLTKPQMCATKGCNAIARWRPEITVWASGTKKTPSNGLKMNLFLAACDDHCDLNPNAFWTKEGKKQVTDALRQAGEQIGRVYAAPDFGTTEIEWVPLSKPLDTK